MHCDGLPSTRRPQLAHQLGQVGGDPATMLPSVEGTASTTIMPSLDQATDHPRHGRILMRVVRNMTSLRFSGSFSL